MPSCAPQGESLSGEFIWAEHVLPGVLVTHGKMPPLPSCAVLPDFGAFLATFLRAAISTPATRLVPTLDRAMVAGAKADALRETERAGGRDER